MSIKNVHLNKLLKAFYLPENKLTSLLRDDIRSEIAKKNGLSTSGGEFYTPFWSDAKAHILGTNDLATMTASRIAANDRRKRLYPLLRDGFLDWWQFRRRWSNQPFSFHEFAPKSKHEFEELGATVKVENVVGLTIGDQSNRIIYPYFFEEPTVIDSMARLGLWLMSVALPEHHSEEMRILDIMRGKSYSSSDVSLTGNEESEFVFQYKRIIVRWEELWEDY